MTKRRPSIRGPCSPHSRTWQMRYTLSSATRTALKAAVTAERAAAESLTIAHTQLELGDVSYLALLNAEQTYQQAVIGRVQALGNRYADTAALFQALGGGWWNRTDARF